jgi:hypothetical protein
MTTGELLAMLTFGADRILSNEKGRPPTDADLNLILDRSAVTCRGSVNRIFGYLVSLDVLTTTPAGTCWTGMATFCVIHGWRL